jgi:phenylacetyl-CoA:acceptor oxidoreductase subunit 1
MACPYRQRTRYEGRQEYHSGQGYTPWENIGEDLYPLQENTVIKCNFCVEKLDDGLAKGLTPGVDREATPACVIACPTMARVFGDLDKADGDAARLIREKKGEQLHSDFGTDPSVYYLDY